MAGASPMQNGLTEEERAVMSTAGFVAIAITVLFASIVYELTVISRFITEQKLKQQPQDERARRYPAP
jgi:hypothetical protein